MTHSTAPSPDLSELAIPASHDSFFLLGRLLARYHEQGLSIQQPESSIVYEPWEGRWQIQPDALTPASITPSQAVEQCQRMYEQLGNERGKSVKAGYLQRAAQRLEDQQPGFTQTLSKHWFSSPTTWTKPRPVNFNLLTTLDRCGSRIQINDGRLKVVFEREAKASQPITDRELLLVTVVLTITGGNLRDWIAYMEKIEPQRSCNYLLGGFLRGELLQEGRVSGLLPRLLGIRGPKERLLALLNRQPLPEQVLLAFVGSVLTYQPAKATIFEGMELMGLLNKSIFTSSAKLPFHEQEALLEALMDGLSTLARLAEQQGLREESIQLAQMALFLMQWMGADIGEATEGKLSRFECQEEQYNWRRLSNGADLPKMILFPLMGFANAASIVDLKCFLSSRESFQKKKVQNLLWSALWRAIDRQRWILRLTYQHLKSCPQPDVLLKEMLPGLEINIKQLQSALAQHMRACELTLKHNTPATWVRSWLDASESGSGFRLQTEVQLTLTLEQSLKDKSSIDRLLPLLAQLFPEVAVEASLTNNTAPENILHTPQERQARLNELLTQYHQGEIPEPKELLRLMEDSGDMIFCSYCSIMVLLISIKQQDWPLARRMAQYLLVTFESAYDLPGIPLAYYGFGEELLSVQPILDALVLLKENIPHDPAVPQLIDRYLERYQN